MTTIATVEIAPRPRIATAGIGVSAAWPIAVPAAFLFVGAVVGYAFSLDKPIAMERLVGLIVASVLAAAALPASRRVRHPDAILLGASLLALAGAMWVIAATGPDVFRGSLGGVLDRAFSKLFGLVNLTNSVAEANTWFIVGYNGVIDLSLVVIFACGALAFERRRSLRAVPLGLLMLIGVVLLVGAGARGGLTGLAAGICAVGLYVWPRRYAVLAFVAAPAALAVAALGILDKGLEFSSTAGRLTYWADLARLLVEYPLTGVGLGVDSANSIALQYEINPDPERIFYAHNTFVQSYLEQGPLGLFGMLLLPGLVVLAALLARRHGLVPGHRPLMVAGLGVVGGMEAHGLTDQVVTTNIGTLLLLFGCAAVFSSLPPDALRVIARWAVRASAVLAGALALLTLVGLALPAGRAQLLLDLGGLEMNAALAQRSQSPERAPMLAQADSVLSAALAQDPSHPAVLRDLAWVRSARFDDSGALSALNTAAQSPRIDAFDMLQIAHVYRDLGATDQAYALATRAYTIWGRSEEDAVMGTYAQATLSDSRARTLADQGEAAMRARHFGDANALFSQALGFEPKSAYLESRIGASQRAVDKYGPSPR